MREPQVKPTWKDYKCGASVGRGHVLLAWRAAGNRTETETAPILISAAGHPSKTNDDERVPRSDEGLS